MQGPTIVNPLPRGSISSPIRQGLKSTTTPSVLIPPSQQLPQQIRPSILHSKQLKRDSLQNAAISLGNIVTADGTTSLKIAGGNVPPNLAVKLPNILRTPSGHPHSPHGNF